MPKRVVRVLHADGSMLRDGIARIQQELGVDPGFPPDVEEAAQHAARNPRMPDLDRTDIPFVTLDPATSMDLDQALHLERERDTERSFSARSVGIGHAVFATGEGG